MSRKEYGSRGGPYSRRDVYDLNVLEEALPSHSTSSDSRTGRSSDTRTGRPSRRFEDSPPPAPSNRGSSRFIDPYSDDDESDYASTSRRRRRSSHRSPSPQYNTTTTTTSRRHPSNTQSTKPKHSKYKSSRSDVPKPQPYLHNRDGEKRDTDLYSKAYDPRYWSKSEYNASARDSNPYDSYGSSDRKRKDSRYIPHSSHY